MSRKFCRAALAAAVVLGALRLADFMLFTDADGFCTLGSAWMRYAVAAAYWAAVFFAPLRFPPALRRVPARRLMAVMAVLAVPAAAYEAMEGLASLSASQTTLARVPEMQGTVLFWTALGIVAGAGWLVFAAWCAVLGTSRVPPQEMDGAARMLGAAAWIPFLARALRQYGESHPSVHHLLRIVSVFAFVAAALFVCKLFGLTVLSQDEAVRRRTASSGLLCFFLCTCVYLPQAAASAVRGMTQWTELAGGALALGVLGCAGAAAAMALSTDCIRQPQTEEAPAEGREDDEDPSSGF